VGDAPVVRRKGWTDGHGVTWRDKTWLFVTYLPTRLLKVADIPDRKQAPLNEAACACGPVPA